MFTGEVWNCTNLVWTDLAGLTMYRECRRMSVMTRWNALVVICLFGLTLPSGLYAQAVTVPHVAPAPLIRLTGVLRAVEEPRISAFPVLRVWVAGKRWRFHVTQVEAVMPAYRAQDKLRRVSTLGLRLVARHALLATLQSANMHDRPIVIEGWLRVKAAVLQVRSIQAVETAQSNCR